MCCGHWLHHPMLESFCQVLNLKTGCEVFIGYCGGSAWVIVGGRLGCCCLWEQIYNLFMLGTTPRGGADENWIGKNMRIFIIIIITRPRPAFGRLGLGRSSGGKTSGGVSTPHFAPSALSSALKQYILALSSRSSSSWQSPSSVWYAGSVMGYNQKYNDMPLSLWQGR